MTALQHTRILSFSESLFCCVSCLIWSLRLSISSWSSAHNCDNRSVPSSSFSDIAVAFMASRLLWKLATLRPCTQNHKHFQPKECYYISIFVREKLDQQTRYPILNRQVVKQYFSTHCVNEDIYKCTILLQIKDTKAILNFYKNENVFTCIKKIKYNRHNTLPGWLFCKFFNSSVISRTSAFIFSQLSLFLLFLVSIFCISDTQLLI